MYGLVHGDDDGRVVVGRALLSSLVRSVVVEVIDVLADYGLSVPLVVDQHVVGAFLSEAAAPAFDEAGCPRGAGRSLDHGDASGGKHRVEGGGVLGVAVADEEPEPVGPLAQVEGE